MIYKERERERERERQAGRQTDRQRETETERQTDRETDRDRQTDRDTETERLEESVYCVFPYKSLPAAIIMIKSVVHWEHLSMFSGNNT